MLTLSLFLVYLYIILQFFEGFQWLELLLCCLVEKVFWSSRGTRVLEPGFLKKFGKASLPLLIWAEGGLRFANEISCIVILLLEITLFLLIIRVILIDLRITTGLPVWLLLQLLLRLLDMTLELPHPLTLVRLPLILMDGSLHVGSFPGLAEVRGGLVGPRQCGEQVCH